MTKQLSRFLLFIRNKKKAIISRMQKSLFAKCGSNVTVGYDCTFYYNNIYVGSNVYIGSRASFIATVSRITIGNYVMFGPNVTILGGNHRIDMIGRYMFDITEQDKLPENDEEVIIENDVWIGANVTILKGVTIGRGSVVAAGAVVIKSCEPYSIIGGVPAKLIKRRFTEEDIKRHESILDI